MTCVLSCLLLRLYANRLLLIGTPRNPESANTTPQKRGSLIDRMRNSPADSQKSGASGTTEGGKEKKKGLFSRLKEKLK